MKGGYEMRCDLFKRPAGGHAHFFYLSTDKCCTHLGSEVQNRVVTAAAKGNLLLTLCSVGQRQQLHLTGWALMY